MTEGLRLRAAAAQLIGLAALVVLASAAHARLPLGELYFLKSAVWFVAIATLAVVFISEDSHPFRRLGPANHVTTARAVLVALVVLSIGLLGIGKLVLVSSRGNDCGRGPSSLTIVSCSPEKLKPKTSTP